MPQGISREAACAEIEQVLRKSENSLLHAASSAGTRPPLSDECKRAQIYAQKEAALLLSSRMGTEHLLLGLLREEGCFASRVMRKYGAELEKIRAGLAASTPPNDLSSNQRLQ